MVQEDVFVGCNVTYVAPKKKGAANAEKDLEDEQIVWFDKWLTSRTTPRRWLKAMATSRRTVHLWVTRTVVDEGKERSIGIGQRSRSTLERIQSQIPKVWTGLLSVAVVVGVRQRLTSLVPVYGSEQQANN